MKRDKNLTVEELHSYIQNNCNVCIENDLEYCIKNSTLETRNEYAKTYGCICECNCHCCKNYKDCY